MADVNTTVADCDSARDEVCEGATCKDSYTEKESSHNPDKLKDHKAADNVAESIQNSEETPVGVQETGETQDSISYRPLQNEVLFWDKEEKRFKDDVQNHLKWIEETSVDMFTEQSPSLNFSKLCRRTRDDHRKVLDLTLYGEYHLMKEVRDVGACFDTLRMEFEKFSLRVDLLKPTINNNVNHISSGDSPQRVTEYIENKFGTQTGILKITHSGYICIYNSERRLGISYEYLTKDNFLGNAKRKKHFMVDDRVESGFCPSCEDFRMDDFHIGHLAASGNYKSSQDQRNDTFNLTNCVPQNTKGNKWEKIEIYTQHLLQKHNKEGALVITGWLMIESLKDGRIAIVIHRKQNTLSVPTHLFKVVITEVENKPDGLAVFIVPNEPNEGRSFDHCSAYERLRIIDYIHGYSLAPKIDKRKLLDLSDHFNTHVMSDIELKHFITKKKLMDARNETNLDSAYASFLNGLLKPSKSLEQLYRSRKQDFDREFNN